MLPMLRLLLWPYITCVHSLFGQAKRARLCVCVANGGALICFRALRLLERRDGQQQRHQQQHTPKSFRYMNMMTCDDQYKIEVFGVRKFGAFEMSCRSVKWLLNWIKR